jgi:hypothetical protein
MVVEAENRRQDEVSLLAVEAMLLLPPRVGDFAGSGRQGLRALRTFVVGYGSSWSRSDGFSSSSTMIEVGKRNNVNLLNCERERCEVQVLLRTKAYQFSTVSVGTANSQTLPARK